MYCLLNIKQYKILVSGFYFIGHVIKYNNRDSGITLVCNISNCHCSLDGILVFDQMLKFHPSLVSRAFVSDIGVQWYRPRTYVLALRQLLQHQ